MKIIGLGNALVDVLIRLKNDEILSELDIKKGAMDMVDEEKTKLIRETLNGLPETQAPGGSVCNSMRALSKLGASTGFLGKTGTDALGDYYEAALQQMGVMPYMAKQAGLSGSCTVLISPDGERTMNTFLGPAPTLSPEEITNDVLAGYQCIYIEGYLLVNPELVRETMRKAKALGLKVALDLSNFNIVEAFRDLLDEIIPAYVDILFSNESEAEAFTRLPARDAIKELAKQVEIALVTLGKEGALVAFGEELIAVKAAGGKPIDTTGAGDHFAAGFLYGQSKGASLKESAEIGSLLAGYVIDVIGAQIPDEHWEQIKLKVATILG